MRVALLIWDPRCFDEKQPEAIKMVLKIAKLVRGYSPRCIIKAGWGTQTKVAECFDLCVRLMESVRDAGDEGAVAKLMDASPKGWKEVTDFRT